MNQDEMRAYVFEKLYNAEHLTKARQIKILLKQNQKLHSIICQLKLTIEHLEERND